VSAAGEKLRLYREELAFALRAPRGLSHKARLLSETVRFHSRNARAKEADPRRRITTRLRFHGRDLAISLRPDDGDIAVLYEIFAREAYRLEAHDVRGAEVRTIVDAGANIGLASLYFAAVYPRAQIVAIEPNPDNFALLAENARQEPRITILQACLTGLPDQSVFISTTGRGSHFQSNTGGHGVPIRGLSLPQICETRGLDHIDLLKIDIEGGEKDVFAHPAFLGRTGAIVAELHPGYDIGNLKAAVAPFGFEARISEFAGDPNVVIASKTR